VQPKPGSYELAPVGRTIAFLALLAQPHERKAVFDRVPRGHLRRAAADAAAVPGILAGSASAGSGPEGTPKATSLLGG